MTILHYTCATPHACTVTQADQIVYATRSNQECENGAIVRRALDQHSVSSETKLPLFHQKRTFKPKEEEPHYYVALMETKVGKLTCTHSRSHKYKTFSFLIHKALKTI